MPRPLPKSQPVFRVAASTMLGMRIAQYRKRLRVSTAALAANAGLSENLVKRIESGVVAKPDLFEILSLLDALDCTIDQLLCGIPRNEGELQEHLYRMRPDIVADLLSGIPPPSEHKDDAPTGVRSWKTCGQQRSVR